MTDTARVLTASANIFTGRGILKGVMVSVTAADTVSLLTIYDSTTASGTVIFQQTFYSEQQPFYILFTDIFAPRFYDGLYVNISGDLNVQVWASQR